MVKLSYRESKHAYAGETFCFSGQADVKIRITRATWSSSALQYRIAIWRLSEIVQYMTANNVFACVIVDLYWSGDGAPVLLGVIEIFPDPMPDIAASNESQDSVRIGRRAERTYKSLDLANFTSIGRNEADLAAYTSVGNLSVFLELQGPRLSGPDVFMTTFLALVRIASFQTGQLVHNFEVRDIALKNVAEYFVAKHRFEAITFVLQVGGTPVGSGILRKSSKTSSIISQKV